MINKFVKLHWVDAVGYKLPAGGSPPQKLIKRMTTGWFVEENDNYLIIKYPLIFNYNNKKRSYTFYSRDTNRRRVFFRIPKGMVKKVEPVVMDFKERVMRLIVFGKL